MTSCKKKRKAKNSHINNGGEKNTLSKVKLKRVAYYTKADRQVIKRSTDSEAKYE